MIERVREIATEQFASGAKGRRFESYRAYQPLSDNQSLTSHQAGSEGFRPFALPRNSGVSDHQLITCTPRRQTVSVEGRS
jgi:hypothetical protein